MSLRWAPVLTALCALAANPVQAQNPKVNLRLEQVNLAEAMAALSKAADIPVHLYQPRLPPNFPQRPAEARHLEKATFNWEGVTFAKALRELSERYQLRPIRRFGTYEFYPGTPPAKLPEKLTGLVELEGMRLFARGVVISEHSNRALNFVGEDPQLGESTQLTVTLAGLLAERDPLTLAGIENIVATDDRGNRLESRRETAFYASSESGSFPDEWTSNLTFRSPDPRARKITSIQGDVIVYRSVRTRKVEVPLPLPEKIVKREAGEALVIFSAYRELPRVDPEDDQVEIPGLQPNFGFRGRPPVQGPVVRVRVATPGNVAQGYAAREGPVVIGESGKVYRGTPLGGSSTVGNGGMRVSDAVYYFPDIEERAVRMVWETLEKGETVKLASFRMTDIPLPTPPPGERPAAVPGLPGADVAAPARLEPLPDHPWVFRGGATITGRVERLGKPAPGGTLELGMARVVAGKAGPVRWTELPIDSQGGIRLHQVQPGTYQVHLRYRAVSLVKAGTGKWVNSTATVTVRAGQEFVLPPLRWVATVMPR